MHDISHEANVQWGGGIYDPCRVSKLSVVELSGKSVDCSRKILIIHGKFYPRPIFNPVMTGQMQNFAK